jgi:hypothetical protein
MASDQSPPDEQAPSVDFPRAEVRLGTLPAGAAHTFEQFQTESDRGAALVGVAYLDDQLKGLFKAKMLDESKIAELLEGYGPLSTLSARADVAYGLGWLGPKTYRDITLLRRIRNDFAHAHEPLTFSTQAIQQRCDQLELPQAIGGHLSDSKTKFLFTVSMLAFRIEAQAKQTERVEPGRDLQISPVVHAHKQTLGQP